MAASLETRPPFLDHRLVELAFSLPSNLKVRRGTSKWIIKEIARRYLPNDLVDRPKVGFTVPLDSWFRGSLKEMSFDLLTSRSSFVGNTFDRKYVLNLLNSHSEGRRDEQSRIWTLLSLEVWHRELLSRQLLIPSVNN
jgi:asparagine synthase (glutamine-hydrolysing)